MLCFSPNQVQAQHESPANPYSCPDTINLTYGGGAPLGTTCMGESGSQEQQCGFPYTYAGKSSYQCAAVDAGGPWCYSQTGAAASNSPACSVNTTKGCQVPTLRFTAGRDLYRNPIPAAGSGPFEG